MDHRYRDIYPLPLPRPDRLIREIEEAVTRAELPTYSLCQTVRIYALEAFARGVAPERMIISLKAALFHNTLLLSHSERAALVEAVIPCAIEGYYLAPHATRGAAQEAAGAA